MAGQARYVIHMARELRIEDRGEGNAPLPVLVTLERHIVTGHTWLAEVTGIDEEAPGGFAQTFLDPMGENLSRGGNGVRMYVIEHDGVYQANGPWQGFEQQRVVLHVKDGTIKILANSTEGDTPAKVRTALYMVLTGAPKPRKARAKKEAIPA